MQGRSPARHSETASRPPRKASELRGNTSFSVDSPCPLHRLVKTPILRSAASDDPSVWSPAGLPPPLVRPLFSTEITHNSASVSSTAALLSLSCSRQVMDRMGCSGAAVRAKGAVLPLSRKRSNERAGRLAFVKLILRPQCCFRGRKLRVGLSMLALH